MKNWKIFLLLIFVLVSLGIASTDPFSIDPNVKFEQTKPDSTPEQTDNKKTDEAALPSINSEVQIQDTSEQDTNEMVIPKLTRPVIDQASLFSSDEHQYLERKILAIHQQQGPQIQILVIPSLQGQSIEEYSIRVAEKWKIGNKASGNGILILMAQQEREIRIEVGEGIEGEVTDFKAYQIIQEKIIPDFKRGMFFPGFNSAIDELAGLFNIETEQDNISATKKSNNLRNAVSLREQRERQFKLVLPIFIFFISFPLIQRLFRNKKFFTAASSSLYMAGLNFFINGELFLVIFGLIIGLAIGIMGPLNFIQAVLIGAGGRARGGRGGGGGWSGGGGGFSGGGASGRW